ncbi:MAG: hypothetical protein JXL80_06390 [Planctomycetes bacterium]|nr:hypothetical protein [Planctomycetota bacterium]
MAAQMSADVPLPADSKANIQLTSRVTQSWYAAEKLLVVMLIDGFTVRQGEWTLTCRDGVAWCDESQWTDQNKVVGIYAEDNVTISGPGLAEPVKLDMVYLTLTTGGTVERPHEDVERSGDAEPLYLRARRFRSDVLAKAAEEGTETGTPKTPATTEGPKTQPGDETTATDEEPAAERGQEIIIGALDDVRQVTFESRMDGEERVNIWTGGVLVSQGELEIRSDDLVIWGDTGKGSGVQAYLEGNVVINQGRRLIRATRAYYDFDRQQALIHDAKVQSFSTAREVPLYYYAKSLRQLAEGKFVAEKASMTTDAFGHPQWAMSGSEFEIVDLSGEDEQGKSVNRIWFSAENVSTSIRGVPVTWWPRLSGDLQQEWTPLRRINLSQNSNKGTGFETEWYLWRLLGVREVPDGFSKTYLDLNLYSDRGPYMSVNGDYRRERFFGEFMTNYIRDYGQDNIAGDDFDPPSEDRGRVTWRHRHFLPYEWQVTGELSWLSDEQYLREWYEEEDAQGKDQETLLHLKKQSRNQVFTALFKGRINDWQDEVAAAPRLDYMAIGEPLLNDRLTYYGRGTYMYGHVNVDERVRRPEDSPWTNIADTRHEVDMPLQIGFVKVVPFAEARLSYFEETFDREPVSQRMIMRGADSRTWAEAGLRASWYLTKVYDGVQSRFWDLNRLCHVNTFDIEAAVADTDLGSRHLYPFDEPGSAEAKLVRGVDDTDVYRLGWRNRLQTKRGPNQKVVDWITADLLMTWFNNTETPRVSVDDDRAANNLKMDCSWQLSDTTSVVGDVYYTTNDGRVRTANAGLAIARTPRLSYYLGSRYIRGADSSVGTFGVDYVINRKWKFHLYEQYEFNNTRTNSGTRFEFERRMASWLMRVAMEWDPGEDERTFYVEFQPIGVPEITIGN